MKDKSKKLYIFTIFIAILIFTSSLNVLAIGHETNLFVVKYTKRAGQIYTHEKPTPTSEQIPVEGVTFYLWKIDNNKSYEDLNNMSVEELNNKYGNPQEAVTNKDGISSFGNKAEGVYYIRENSKLYIASSLITLPIFENGKYLENIYIYPKQGADIPQGDIEIKIIKKDEAGKRLSGAKFQLYMEVEREKGKSFIDQEGNTIYGLGVNVVNGVAKSYALDPQIIVSDLNGEIKVLGLSKGKYFLVEVEAPQGYVLLTYPIKFEPEKDISAIEIINKKNPPGENFIKIDKDGNPIPGAKFKLFTGIKDSKGELVYTPVLRNNEQYVVTSKADGKFEFIDIPAGKYYIVEIEAPTFNGVRYKPLETVLAIEINEKTYKDGKIIEVINMPEEPITPPNNPVKPPNTPVQPPEEPIVPPESPQPVKIGEPINKPIVPSSPKKVTTGIKIPKTGNVSLFLSILIGLSMISLGTYIYTREGLKSNREKSII